ncbi:MAG: FmdB family transcriptional regulator [Coriobacteriia bacterium]|nr:FmdB family transcriptional regulator [Coriobacteriia bacterium]
MPIYDYHCAACEKTFEIVRSMGSSSDVNCPECGTLATRVFTPVGLSFKGPGFYSTDYRGVQPMGCPQPGDMPAGACPSCDACPPPPSAAEKPKPMKPYDFAQQLMGRAAPSSK